jgi:hypothetical protein
MATNVRSVSFTESTIFPLSVWVPTIGKRSDIEGVYANLSTSLSGTLIVTLEAFIEGVYKPFLQFSLGESDWRYSNMYIPITTHLLTDQGDGTQAMVRLIATISPSTVLYTGFVSMLGDDSP